jgi:cell division protease FtsH
VAYHEAGHAIVGECMDGAEKVAKISIVPRGLAALGYTMHLPTEERYIMTESELKARLAAMLGGRAAEWIMFKGLSTGASDDLARATDLARAMVTDYGMSERIGPLSLKRGRRPAFVPNDGVADLREHGEQVADLVDQEVKRIVEQAEHNARVVLEARRPALEHIAQRLIEKEYLDGEELRQLLTDARASSVVTAPVVKDAAASA